MREFEFVVTLELGIHARPAGLIAAEMRRYSSEITLSKGFYTADGKKIFQIMGLKARLGDTVRVSISGENEETEYSSIKSWFINNL